MPARPRSSHRLRALLMAAVLALPLLGISSASASPPVPGSVGHDVAAPQCGAALPTSGTFGIVGVTNGRAFSANPCLAAQWQWASGFSASPALYTNPANPAPTSSYYWPVSGSSDPVLCVNAASTTDPGCAYDYGWHAAANALSTAAAAISSAAALAAPWWLDVETGNTYNGNGTSNAADLQGMVDYLRGAGVPSVGFYSTAYQWGVITGGWTTSNDASYRAAWANEFTPAYPLSASPVWVAGGSSLSSAQSNCGTSFTGGATTLAQYPDGSFDGNLACGTSTPPPPPPPPSTTAPGAPQGLIASPAATGSSGISLTWTAPSSDGGAAVTSYQVSRSTTSGSESPYATVASSTSFRDTRAKAGRRYYYRVAATNSVGTGPASGEASTTAR